MRRVKINNEMKVWKVIKDEYNGRLWRVELKELLTVSVQRLIHFVNQTESEYMGDGACYNNHLELQYSFRVKLHHLARIAFM